MCKTVDESKARPDVGCTELLSLVSFLCGYISKLDQLRYKIYAWKPKDGDLHEYLIGKWPIIQGTRNQMDLDKIGKLQWTSKDVATAVNFVLKDNDPGQPRLAQTKKDVRHV